MRTESIDERRVAYFVSPHGFGHAARAAAIMEAATTLDPSLRFEIFTSVPRWFFQQSLTKTFGYHAINTDIGLAQTTPLVVDLHETLRRLDDFLPFDDALIEALARQIRALGCSLVVCDIAPLGLSVSERAGVQSVLVENFTWDWIYEAYTKQDARFQAHVDYLKHEFGRAQFHVQTEPVCAPQSDAALVSPPVSRAPREPMTRTRARLSIPDDARAVLITMGGIETRHRFLDGLGKRSEIFFIVPGGSERQERRGNIVLLPHASDFYHPDLVSAVDVVVGKIGYSTVAESYQAAVPFCYVMRKGFRESEALARFVKSKMSGRAVTEDEFERGLWMESLDELLNAPRARRTRPNGAQAVAAFLAKVMWTILDFRFWILDWSGSESCRASITYR